MVWWQEALSLVSTARTVKCGRLGRGPSLACRIVAVVGVNGTVTEKNSELVEMRLTMLIFLISRQHSTYRETNHMKRGDQKGPAGANTE